MIPSAKRTCCAAVRAAALGVGAAIAIIRIASAAPGDGLEAYRNLARGPERAQLLAIARAAMEAHWDAARDTAATGADVAWPGPPAGLFVTLAGPRGTRACVGSVTPTHGSLGATLQALAVEALSADRRRPAIRRDELDSLRVVIAFAGPAEPVEPALVDPASEGLLVCGADVAVAFLPGEARTVSWALREARRIGALRAGGDVTYRRFAAVVIAEPAPPQRSSSGDPNAAP